MKWLLTALALLFAAPAQAQGTIPVAMNIQQDVNGRPLAGALLYLYVVGTVATPQIAFQDVGLTQALPWPIAADQVGRLPMFYIPSGSVHARLTDATGNVQFDYPNVLVIGASGGGGGGGGGGADPSSVATTGDIKFRLGLETSLNGWVTLNGQTIGNADSGAAHAAPEMQNLFVYLWGNCSDAHCPVTPSRGGSAIADFNAKKQLKLLDMRGRVAVGRDCMGSVCQGRLLASNITSGGSDGVNTPAASGGASNQAIGKSNLPSLSLPVNVTSVNVTGGNHGHTATVSGGVNGGSGNLNVTYGAGGNNANFPAPTSTITVSIGNSGALSMSGTGSGSASLNGGGVAFPLMNPFLLVTWWIKL